MARSGAAQPMTTATGTNSADRVADILLAFGAADGPLGVSELSRSVGLSKAVVHRVLQSLVSRGLVRTVGDGAYTLGPAAIQLSIRGWGQFNIRSTAEPVLRKLRDATGETTTLSVLVGHSRIYLDQYESRQEVKMVVDIGPRYPLHSGASSRSILAFLPPSFTDEAVAQLQTTRAGFDEARYRAELEEIRNQGYAISLNERDTGAASVAAPFFDSVGNVLGSISASGPVGRFEGARHDKQISLVTAAARQITSRL